MSKKQFLKIFELLGMKSNGINPLCHAPFNNLLINQSGEFKICCHNNTYILGKYPEQSIDEIWFGEKRKAIIQEFLDQKIPESCKHCIEKGININSPDSKINYSKNKKTPSFKNYPQQIEFLLSNKCNLDCIMCADNISSSSSYIKLVKDKNRTDKIVFDNNFIQQLKPYLKHLKYSVFSGGEPFLIPIYEKIWEFISLNNPKSTIYVQTNGTVLNDKIKNLLSKYHLNIGISIDSFIKKTYESIRRNANFERTMCNLNYFIEHSQSIQSGMTLMVTPMTVNALEIPNMVNFCNTKGIYFSISILEWPKHLAIWSLSSSELMLILENYQNFKNPIDETNPILLKNYKSFRYFKELVEEYAHQKRYFEQHQAIIENNILDISQKIALTIHFDIEEAIEKMNLSSTLKKATLEKSIKLLDRYFKQFSQKFSNPDFFYVFFIKTPKPIFIEHILNYDETAIEKILEEKLDEFAFLLQTKSYNRIIDFESYE